MKDEQKIAGVFLIVMFILHLFIFDVIENTLDFFVLIAIAGGLGFAFLIWSYFDRIIFKEKKGKRND